jgi:hypothetical protein
MRETFTSGSVGRAPGNRCLYPEADCLQRPLVPRCAPRQLKPYPRESGWESEECPKGQPPYRSRNRQKGPEHGGKAGGAEKAQTSQTCKTCMAG